MCEGPCDHKVCGTWHNAACIVSIHSLTAVSSLHYTTLRNPRAQSARKVISRTFQKSHHNPFPSAIIGPRVPHLTRDSSVNILMPPPARKSPPLEPATAELAQTKLARLSSTSCGSLANKDICPCLRRPPYLRPPHSTPPATSAPPSSDSNPPATTPRSTIPACPQPPSPPQLPALFSSLLPQHTPPHHLLRISASSSHPSENTLRNLPPPCLRPQPRAPVAPPSPLHFPQYPAPRPSAPHSCVHGLSAPSAHLARSASPPPSPPLTSPLTSHPTPPTHAAGTASVASYTSPPCPSHSLQQASSPHHVTQPASSARLQQLPPPPPLSRTPPPPAMPRLLP